MRLSYLYVTDGIGKGKPVGGSVSHIKGTISQLAKRAAVTFYSDTAPELGAEVRRVKVEPSPGYELFKEINKLRFNYRFHRVVKDDLMAAGTDLIYQRYSGYDWTGAKLARDLNVPFFLEFNSSEYWKSVNGWDRRTFNHLLRYSERALLSAADRVFVVSEVLRRQLLADGVGGHKIVVNPNGVDADFFSPAAVKEERRAQIAAGLDLAGRKVVGFTGTFGPWHGIEIIVESMKALIPQRPDLVFLLIGEGELHNLVATAINEHGLGGNARLVGRVDHADIPAYLSLCDVLLCPTLPGGEKSDFFGSPTKLFEYMAMEKPVIASKVGQIAEVISHDENGLLIEPGDHRAMGRRIIELVQDDARARRLGLSARKTVCAGYTWAMNADRIIGEYMLFKRGMRRP